MTKHLLLYILIIVCPILKLNGQTTFSIEKFNEVKSSIEKIKENVEFLQVWANNDNIEENIKQDILFYNQYSLLLNNQQEFNLDSFNQYITEQYQKKNKCAAEASLTLANLYALGNQFDNAIKHSEDVISYYNQIEVKDSSHIAYANCIIGHSYIGKYEFESAYEPLKESLNYFQPKDSLDNMYSLALTNLAAVESNKADFHSAYKHSRLATILRGITFGEKSTGYAESAYTLSASAFALEKYDEAIKYGEVVLDYYKDNAINDSINKAQIEYVIGSSYFALGNNIKACKNLTNAQNHFPTNMQSTNIVYTKILNNLCLVYRELEEYPKALQLIENSFLIIGKLVKNDNVDYATTMHNLSLCLKDNNQNNEALEYGEKARDILAKYKNNPNLIKCLTNLSSCYLETNQYALAKKRGEEARALMIKYSNINSDEYASCLSTLAYSYFANEELDIAIKYQEEALDISRKNNSIDGIIESLFNLGRYSYDKDQYDDAIRYYEEAFNLGENIKGIKDSNYYYSLLYLSRSYRELGNYSKAIITAEEYIIGVKNIYGKNTIQYIDALENLASTYEHIGNIDKATLYQNEIFEVFDVLNSSNKGNINRYAISLANKALTLSYKSDVLDNLNYMEDALKLNQNAINILNNNSFTIPIDIVINNIEYKIGLSLYKESLYDIEMVINTINKNTFQYVRLLHLKAISLSHINNYQEALNVNSEALLLTEKLLGDSHPYWIRVLYRQVLYYLVTGNDSLFIINLKRLDTSVRKCIHEQLSTLIQADRTSVYNVMRTFYDEVADMIFLTNYKKEIKEILYNGILLTKGLLLSIERSSNRSMQISKNPVIQNDILLLNHYKKVYTESMKLYKSDADSLYILIRNIERKILQNNKEELNVNNYFITWKDIQMNLSDNEIAIEFINYPYFEFDTDKNVYGAIAIRKDWEEPKFIILKKENIINHYFNKTQDRIRYTPTNSPRANYLSSPVKTDNNNELFKCIWDGFIVSEFIKPGDNIYFSASGILHQIPIESLPLGDGKIMSDVYNMYRLSSTRELVKEKKEMKYTQAALYGGLNYDMTDDELISASQTYTKDATTEYFVSRGLLEDSIRGYKWDNLSNTQQEIDYISDLMRKNQITTQTYKGNKGNEESFKALSGHEYNIIHLATHGFFYPDEEAQKKDYFKPMLLNDHYQKYNEVDMSMWRSGLVLSGGNRAWKGDTIPDTVEDGILKAQEIGDLDLRGADLVVLSACNTGQGEVTGEGVFGLQRAFKMAGAKTIVMSLTPVDDQTTMAMMNKFYTNLFSGQSKHDAFYNAQRYIRSIKPDPKYWMGWIMLD